MKKKKAIIDKYDPVIYPRLLYVCKNCTEKDINKLFVGRGGEYIRLGDSYFMYTVPAINKKTNKYVVLVIIHDDAVKESIEDQVNYCAHEADHVNFSICDDIDLSIPTSAQEASAYLTGWATKCIFTTLKKK